MARNSKKPPVHNGKPITAFFARSSQGASLSVTKAATTTSSTTKALIGKACMNTGPHAQSDTSENALKDSVTPTRRSKRINSSPNSLLPPPTSGYSLKRLRSPSLLASHTTTTPVVPRVNHTAVVDDQKNEIIAAAPTERNPKGRKRARMSTIEDSMLSLEFADMVPSSQSDEEELTIEGRNPIPRNCDVAFQLASSSSQFSKTVEDTEMDIDRDVSDRIIVSAQTTDGGISSQPGTPLLDQIMTPPTSDLPSIPPTPIAMDPVSKVAQIIAEIKAKVHAAVSSSPEPVAVELDESSDSSDDEAFPVLQLRTSSIGTNNVQTTSRYSLRKCPGSPLDRNTKATTSRPVSSKNPLPKKIPDPFAALLKEKRLSQRRNGDDAFTRAETRIHNSEKNAFLLEMEEGEDEDELSERDVDNITKVLEDNPDLYANTWSEIEPPKATKVRNHAVLNHSEGGDRKTIFPPKDGILDILKQDKALKQHDQSSKKVSGIRVWPSGPTAANDLSIANGTALRRLSSSGRLVKLFNNCLQHNDLTRASILLNSNFVLSLNVCDRPSVTSDLCDLAFSSPSVPDVLREAAVKALEEFWISNEEPCLDGISFARILTVIESLGADATIISEHNWLILDVEEHHATTASRERTLSHLLSLISACARSKRINSGEVSDIILALLLMGMDISISQNLLRDVTFVVDLVCHSMSWEGSDISDLEIQTCSKILQRVREYDPVNQNRVVQLLSGGSGTTRRIASMVAYYIVTDKDNSERGTYSDAPPLDEILDQFAPYSKASAKLLGKFAVHPNTDYVDLALFVNILGVAVSNLRSYALVGKKLLAEWSALNGSGGHGKPDKPKTDLQLLRECLDDIHSKIVDTRATHLERSRAKATIKGVAMNIHYQGEYWMKNEPDPRPRTLVEYFAKT